MPLLVAAEADRLVFCLSAQLYHQLTPGETAFMSASLARS